MANPFEVKVPNIYEALLAGDQGYDSMRKVAQQRAIQEAGQLYASGDVKGAQAAAARGGSLQALMGFAGLQNQDRDFNRSVSNDARSQQNTDRSFGLQERQINATAGNTAASRDLARQQFEWQKEQGARPEIRMVKDANGNEQPLLVNRNGTVTPVAMPGQGGEANNPFVTGGAMNEAQSKDGLYTDRMLSAEKIFRDPAVIGAGQAPLQKGLSMVPGGNYLVSENYQKFDQAKRNFINATLRRESGAVINPDEFANADKQYFPQPGDSASVLAQKQQNRVDAIKGIGAGAGKGYRPTASFGPGGEMVERPANPRQTQGGQQPQISDGMTATNPQTGQKIIFRGGQWVPAQ